MFAVFFDWRGAGDHRHRVDEFIGCIGGAAMLAIIAILIRCLAARTSALDIAIRQEHVFDRVVGLLHGASGDVAAGQQPLIDQIRQGLVFVRMRGIEIVEANGEIGVIALVFLVYAGNQRLGADVLVQGAQHDGCAVGVIGADIDAVMTTHVLEAHPDVGLDGLDQVSQMNRAIGIG